MDDDYDHLKVLTMILQDKGYCVDAYDDPDMALSKFRPNYYDLAVLDYLMPHPNGLELYRRIREIDSRIRCSILTATNEQLTYDEDNPQKQEGFKVIRKPIGIEKLLMKINCILNYDPT